MDKRERKTFNKLLLAMLARNPAEFRLVSTGGGWIKIKDIHKALQEERLFTHLTPGQIEQYLLIYRPDGLEISEKWVRAVPEALHADIFDYPETRPPRILYLPIRPKASVRVEEHGIAASRESRWLVLSASMDTALLLGKRFHDNPVICKVMAGKAHDSGAVFRFAGADLYLVERLEQRWLEVPKVHREIKRAGRASEPSRGPMSGQTCEPGFHPGPPLPDIGPVFQKMPRRFRKKKRSKGLDKKRKR